MGDSPPQGPEYRWRLDSNINNYDITEPRKIKFDEDVEFDATQVYKTYYLDDRATCHEQGLLIAGKGVTGSEIFWEIYHNGEDITSKIFDALNCEQAELDELGLI